MNDSIAIVLVEPENADNVGAVARAMKNMGLSDLRLVNPPKNWKRRGKMMAVNAFDVLESATLFKSLDLALQDTHLSVGLTRRVGTKRRDYIPFDQSIKLIHKKSKKWKKALVFGRESKGLLNEELSRCDWLTTIPSSPNYGSLNLAQAVMVCAFSLFYSKQMFSESFTEDGAVLVRNIIHTPFIRVTRSEKEDVLARFKEALYALRYSEEGNSVIDRIYGTLNRMLNRAGLLRSEGNMIKGLSRRIVEMTQDREAFGGAPNPKRKHRKSES